MLPNGTYTHEHDSFSAESNMHKDAVVPIFYREKQLNRKKSEAAQRAIYDEYDAAKFLVPGDNTYEHRERVTDDIKRRFPRQWAMYEQGKEQINGMPLESWYKIANNPGLIEEMRAMRIRSVEDLATITDNVVLATMWGLEWRKNAQAELALQKNKTELAEANEGLVAQMQAMAARLAELEGKASVLPESGAVDVAPAATDGGGVDAPRRGPGRPPKA